MWGGKCSPNVPWNILIIPCIYLEAEAILSAILQIAKKCYKLRNYNSLNALLAGLLCTPVHRLKKTWKEVSSKRKKLVICIRVS